MNNVSGKGLLLPGDKPLPGAMLGEVSRGPVEITRCILVTFN